MTNITRRKFIKSSLSSAVVIAIASAIPIDSVLGDEAKESILETIPISIPTRKGIYLPKTDNLVEEITNAAQCSGLIQFNVWINEEQIPEQDDVPSKTISGVIKLAEENNISPSITIQRLYS